MCKAFLDMKQEGIEEERLSHLIETVCKKLLKNKPASLIAEELEEDLQAVERVIRAQRRAGSYDVERIGEMLRAERQE